MLRNMIPELDINRTGEHNCIQAQLVLVSTNIIMHAYNTDLLKSINHIVFIPNPYFSGTDDGKSSTLYN